MKKILIVVVVFIAAAVAAYYVFPEQLAEYFVAAARSSAGLTKKEIKLGDHVLFYPEGGSGPETVLLLHGYSADKDNWLQFAAYLKEYHVVIPDLPGHGESSQLPAAKYDVASQIERLHRFCTAININKFHIAGNSMGGWFAGAYAAGYSADILSVGFFNAAGVQSLRMSEVYKLLERGENPLLLKDEKDIPRLMKIVFFNPPYLPYPLKKLFAQKSAIHRAVNEKISQDLKQGAFSLQADLPKIEAPALILWGDQDKVIDISSVPVFEKGLKNRKTVIIKDCGHVPMMEKPEETAAAYLNFIKSLRH